MLSFERGAPHPKVGSVLVGVGRTHLSGPRNIPRMGDCLPKEQLVVYQVVREASLNAVKHAHPTRVEIVLTMSDSVTLAVEDDGEGFDPRRWMLLLLRAWPYRERVRRIDVTVTIESRKGRGTRLLVVLPSRPPG